MIDTVFDANHRRPRRLPKIGLAAAFLAASTATAMAGGKAAPQFSLRTGAPPAAVKTLVHHATGGKLSIVGWFKGPPGMTGLEVRVAGQSAKSKPQIIWAAPAAQALITGGLFDAGGRDLTTIAAAQLHATASKAPPPAQATASATPSATPAAQTAMQGPPPPLPDLKAQIKKADLQGFSQGHGKLQVIAVVDPNCIFCHKFWTDLHALPHWQSMYTVDWVPVGALKPSSPGKAAAVLAGGVKALDTDERGFNDATETGAISPSDNAKALAAVHHNTMSWAGLMRHYHRPTATPTLIIGGDYVVVSALDTDQLRTLYEAMTGKTAPAASNATAKAAPSSSAKSTAKPAGGKSSGT